MNRAEWAKRLAVAVVAAVVVVAVVAAGAAVDDGRQPAERDYPEYEPNATVSEPIPATGSVEFDASLGGGRGKVLIDESHRNRFSRDEIDPLVTALASAGYEVEFFTGGDLETELAQADAFVVFDPAGEFRDSGNDAVKRFTDNGGRVLILAEPNRVSASSSLFGTSITTDESRVTTLTSQYGMSVGTHFLYNQEHNDGNYKRVVVESAPNSPLSGIDRGTVYTAASVSAVNGQRVLIAAPGTRIDGTAEIETRPTIAVRKGNVLLFGDSTFTTSRYYNVGDNEETLAYVVEFLIGGDREPFSADGTGGGSASNESANGTANESANGTANESANETPAPMPA